MTHGISHFCCKIITFRYRTVSDGESADWWSFCWKHKGQRGRSLSSTCTGVLTPHEDQIMSQSDLLPSGFLTWMALMFSTSWWILEAPSRTAFTPSFLRHQAVTGRRRWSMHLFTSLLETRLYQQGHYTFYAIFFFNSLSFLFTVCFLDNTDDIRALPVPGFVSVCEFETIIWTFRKIK